MGLITRIKKLTKRKYRLKCEVCNEFEKKPRTWVGMLLKWMDLIVHMKLEHPELKDEQIGESFKVQKKVNQ